MLGATCSATCHVGSRLGGTATARGSAAGFASLSVLRRQATTDLVFHQIDDAGPFVGTSRTLYNQTPSMDHGILSVAPVWHSSSVADAINEAAGEALLAAHPDGAKEKDIDGHLPLQLFLMPDSGYRAVWKALEACPLISC